MSYIGQCLCDHLCGAEPLASYGDTKSVDGSGDLYNTGPVRGKATPVQISVALTPTIACVGTATENTA